MLTETKKSEKKDIWAIFFKDNRRDFISSICVTKAKNKEKPRVDVV